MWFWSLNADKVSGVSYQLKVVLSPALFIARRSDPVGRKGSVGVHAPVCVGHVTFLHVYLTSKLGHRSLRLTVPGQSKSLCSCVLLHLCHSPRQSLKEEDRSKSFVSPSLFTWSSSSLNCEPRGWFWSPEGFSRKGTTMIRWWNCFCVRNTKINKPELQPGECLPGRKVCVLCVCLKWELNSVFWVLILLFLPDQKNPTLSPRLDLQSRHLPDFHPGCSCRDPGHCRCHTWQSHLLLMEHEGAGSCALWGLG